MGLYFNFYAEICRQGEWDCPESPVEGEPASYPREFTWLRQRSCAYDLFFHEKALFPFRRGLPPQTEHSRLLHDVLRRYGPQEERMISWIPYPELMVDLWDAPAFLLQGKVPARLAPLFGDGTLPFPEEELAGNGIDTYRIDSLRDAHIVAEPVDRSFGKGLHELKNLSPEIPVAVTWRDSVRGYIGDDRTQAFRGVRQYAADSDIRVISWLC